VDYNDYVRQLEAAWLRLSDVEPPLNPRLIGESGLGKTTLACAVGRKLGRDVYLFQCTMDTRPEDLLITPVLTGDQRIEYRASPVVSAILRGGILLLDEGNWMPERSWASLAPLMDDRRYVESAIAGVKVKAHPNFRLCVTMYVTNGIIDWEHESEFDDRLQCWVDNGWIDPDRLHVGSASRDGPYVQVRANPEVRQVRREFSLITLDRPTWLRGKDSPSFHDEVIEKLIKLHGSADNLYAWLDVFFAFCAGKPVVYYSRYVPSPQIHRVAWRHRVRVIPVPLKRIPQQLLRRVRSFLFASLSRRQWEVMVQRVAEGRAGWLGGET
jgi:hypothetical protein